jgi:hypothetical protein
MVRAGREYLFLLTVQPQSAKVLSADTPMNGIA